MQQRTGYRQNVLHELCAINWIVLFLNLFGVDAFHSFNLNTVCIMNNVCLPYLTGARTWFITHSLHFVRLLNCETSVNFSTPHYILIFYSIVYFLLLPFSFFCRNCWFACLLAYLVVACISHI